MRTPAKRYPISGGSLSRFAAKPMMRASVKLAAIVAISIVLCVIGLGEMIAMAGKEVHALPLRATMQLESALTDRRARRVHPRDQHAGALSVARVLPVPGRRWGGAFGRQGFAGPRQMPSTIDG